MGWSRRLERLGFTVDQMVRCRTSSDAQVYIPAHINGEPVQLIFSNGHTVDSYLYESYAADRGLPVTTGDKDRFTEIVELSACGRTVTNTRALVGGTYRHGTPPIAGYLCMKFLDDGVAAIDASVPAMAFATTRDALALDNPVSRLALDRAFVTTDGQRFLISPQQTSSVTPQYLGKRRPGPNGRTELTLTLPGGLTVTEPVAVRPSNFRVVGSLGVDLFCRWITVFDFPAGELLLFDYD